MKITQAKKYFYAILPLLAGGCNANQGFASNDCEVLPDSATFIVEGREVVMNGSIDCSTQEKLSNILDNNEAISTLVLNVVPGSGDDEANLQLGRMVSAQGLDTRIPDFSFNRDDPEQVLSGLVESGGVDLFLSGINRSIGNNACIGVHSWADSDGNEALDYAQDDAVHQEYIQYYADVGYENGQDFYFFTLASQAADGMHYMTTRELNNWHMDSSSQVMGSCPLDDIQP